MRVSRGQKSQSIPVNIVGSSTFGRREKIDSEYTYNMYISQSGNKKTPVEGLTSYVGYKIGVNSEQFADADRGRAIYTSLALDGLLVVFGNRVYLVRLTFDQKQKKIITFNATILGVLNTETGPVYIAENNKPQICISDEEYIYVYDSQATKFQGTVSNLSGAVFTYTGGSARPLIVGEPIVFTNIGGLGGVTVGVTYYVSSASLESNKFIITNNPTNAKLGTSPTTPTGAFAGATFETQGIFQKVLTNFVPTYLTFHDTYFIATVNDDGEYSPPANNTWRLSEQSNAFVWADDSASIGLLETKPDNTQAVIRFPSGGNLILVFGKNVTEAWYDTGGQLFPYKRNNQFNIDYGVTNAKSIAFLDTIAVWIAENEKSGPQLMYSEGSLPKPIITDGVDFELSNLQNPQDCSAWLYRQDGHLIYHVNFYSDNYSLFYDFKTDRFYNASDHNFNHFHISDVSYYKNQYFGISPNDGNLYIVDTEIPYYETVDKAGNIKQYVVPRVRSCANVRLPSNDLFIANDISLTVQSGETSYRYQTDTTYEILPAVYLSVSRNGGNTFSSESKKEMRHIGLRQNKLQWWGLGASNDFQCKFRFESFGSVLALNANLTVRLPG